MKKYVAELDGELLAGLTLGEGASNSNENPACVAALREKSSACSSSWLNCC